MTRSFHFAFIVAALFSSVFAKSPIDRQLDHEPTWFSSAEGNAMIENVIAWQSTEGSWPKNTDTTVPPPSTGEKARGTFDNSATTPELRFLAKAFDATHDERCQKAFLKGLDHILNAQYPNGGWPQYYPPGKGYARHITFNDGSMIRLMEFLEEIQSYKFLDSKRKAAAKSAYEKGIDCILRCQIMIDGKRTVWCAQHDENDLSPAGARAYELPSLSGGESAAILRFLMKLPMPDEHLRSAINAGVAWFESAKLTGIRIERTANDTLVVPDADAPSLWARFYDLETGHPFFCGRDGVKKTTLAEIERERRRGYAWYSNSGEGVIKDYAKWKERSSAIH